MYSNCAFAFRKLLFFGLLSRPQGTVKTITVPVDLGVSGFELLLTKIKGESMRRVCVVGGTLGSSCARYLRLAVAAERLTVQLPALCVECGAVSTVVKIFAISIWVADLN